MQSPSTQDRLEIHELYARYSWALDTGDTDGYVALFTEDAEATEETRTGELEVRKGRAEIRKLVLKFHDRADFPVTSTRWPSLSLPPIHKAGRITGWSAATPGPPSARVPAHPICIGADTYATWWQRSMVPG